ncbi:hypothetical protein HD806DRAFT_240674 [Xylariaceae sp. AK1471]|nr:hypothetical protein HD806DRAFT_240674 [Xylariaceae sp. AK1471]
MRWRLSFATSRSLWSRAESASRRLQLYMRQLASSGIWTTWNTVVKAVLFGECFSPRIPRLITPFAAVLYNSYLSVVHWH